MALTDNSQQQLISLCPSPVLFIRELQSAWLNLPPLHSRAEANPYQPLCPNGETEAWCKGTCPQPHKKVYTQSKTKAAQAEVREFVLRIAEQTAAHCWDLGHQQRNISLWLCPFLVLSPAAAIRLWHSWVHLQLGLRYPHHTGTCHATPWGFPRK